MLALTSKIKSRYFSFVIFDITKQNRTEEAFRANEKRYQSLPVFF
ncbi:hypothetical protein HRM2_38810 [Desulforapulum autotrophicum HRM2]|uniref:Uncharacterized protein n=1 Tax=Desulforapulum autotrophicum (strain ATCC 43914 / DSM 3382 / VKM B-1955 / HRM2) TaxID=177437 RepID=C0QBD7_DESAH|nr:hypothetical protein HRM2_38810 [Desulforapulum autotrophicum HRM2]